MLSDVRLESARLGDAASIARMSRALIEEGLTWRWTPRAIEGLIRHADTEVLVARGSDAPAGFAIMQFAFERRSAHLVLFAVAPDRPATAYALDVAELDRLLDDPRDPSTSSGACS